MTDNQHRPRRSCGSTQPAAWMRARCRRDLIDPWLVIERRRSGLLRYERARGTVALPIVYAARERRVYVRLAEYNDACHFVDRADVALDVNVRTGGHELIARVAGMGLIVPDASLPADLGRRLEVWPDGMPTRVMVIVPESVRQVPVADDVRYPPLPDADARRPGTFADL